MAFEAAIVGSFIGTVLAMFCFVFWAYSGDDNDDSEDSSDKST